MRLRDEDGQALLLALAFLVFFGLVIAAILGFAEASVRATTNLREQRDIVYAADGAMDGAIHYGRWNLATGAYGAVPCITNITNTGTYTVTLNGETASVTCVVSPLQNPLNTNRRVLFTASVEGEPRVQVEVLYHSAATAPAQVDVLSWTYLR